MRPTYDAIRFDARRYTDENVRFWVPTFCEVGSIRHGEVVIDLGCGTGGFTSALGSSAIGVERDHDLVVHGHSKHGRFKAVVADASALPMRADFADVALASLVLHQVEPLEALREIARVLRPGGRLIVRTVAPDDAAEWVPHRWFPTVAESQRRRMPSVDTVRSACTAAGLRVVSVSAVERERTVAADQAEQSVRHDVLPRYELSAEEIEAGLAQLHAADGDRYVRRHTIVLAVR